MKSLRLLIGALLVGLSLGLIGPVLAGPIGPPNGPPYDPSTVILSQSAAQAGKTFSVSSATINSMYGSTATVKAIILNGVAFTTPPTSGTSVYPATGTIIAPYGANLSTLTVSGMINGSSVTITALFAGATIHGSSCVITGTITGSNLTGTNTGDVSIGAGNGLTITGQILSMTTASTVSTGTLRAVDFNTFNNKLSTNGNGSALTGLTKTQVGLSNVQNVDQTDADNLASGEVNPILLGVNTPTNQKYLRGDSTWQTLNSTAVGLGHVTNDAQVKIADYTQKGGILVGLTPGVFSVLAPGSNGQIISADSTSSVGVKYVPVPTIYPAAATASFPYGFSASTGVFSGGVNGTNVTLTGLFTGTTVYASSGTFTGTVNASNLTGTNSGDVTIGTANGLAATGQTLSMALATAISTGALSEVDWNTFNSKSNVTVYPATATATFPFGVSATTAALSGTISASNLSGTNTGDVTIGTANGLSRASQVLSLSTASASNTGALTSTDWSTFNNKTSTNGATVSNFTITSGTVAVSSLTATNATIASLSSTAVSASSGTITNFAASTVTTTNVVASTATISSGLVWKNNYTQRYSLVFNVKDYGAVGDGVTSCDSAFTAAYAAATAANGVMYIPAGTYKTSTTITGSTYTAIIGDGSRQTIINYGGSSFWVLNTASGTVQTWFTMKGLQINNTAGSYSGAIRWGDPATVSFTENDQHINFFFDDLLITGNRNTPVAGSRGIQLTTFIHSNINDVFVYGYEIDYDLKKFDQSFIKHSLASDFSNYGIYLHNDTGDYVSDETTFIQTTLGNSITGSTSIYVTSAQNLRFYDTYCDASGASVYTCLKMNSVLNGTFDGATINSANTLFNFANVRNFVVKSVGLQNPDQSPAPISTTTWVFGNSNDLTGTGGPFKEPNYGLITVQDCAYQVALSFQGQYGVAIKSSGKYGGVSFFNSMASDLMGLYATQILDRNANATSSIKETSAVFGVNSANKYLAGSNATNAQIVADTNTPTGLAIKIPATASGAVFMDIPYSDITAGSYEFNARIRSTGTLSNAFLAVYYDNGSLKENFSGVTYTPNYQNVNFRFNFSPTLTGSTVSIRMDTSVDLYIDYAYLRPCFNSQIIQKYVAPNIQKIGSDTAPGFRITFSTPTAIPSCSLGDITYSTAPITGTNVGWTCVTTGTPGTWKTFGTIGP